jgi:hypothetical protein
MVCREFFSRGMVLVLLALSSLPAAAESTDAGGWRYGAHLSLWGPTVRGNTASGSDIKLSFKDIVNSRKAAYMAMLSAENGKWSLKADLLYMDLLDTNRSTSDPLGIPLKSKVDVELQAFTTTLLGGYRVYEREAFRLELLGGARLLWIQADTDVRIAGPNQIIRSSASDSSSVWDAVVGFRAETDLADKWYTTFYGDIGTGDSDYTWQALWSINYRFKSLDASLGYRHLEFNLDKGAALDDLKIRGPFVGGRFWF